MRRGTPLSSAPYARRYAPILTRFLRLTLVALTAYIVMTFGSGINAATLATPHLLNGGDSGLDSNPSVATDSDGNWVTVWDSTSIPGSGVSVDRDILVSRSGDSGQTWSIPMRLGTNASVDAGDDVEPVVETDGAGTWITVWDSGDDLGNTIGGDHDIVYARSTNNGQNWSIPAPVNTDAATDDIGGSKQDVHPDFAIAGGTWIAIWAAPGGESSIRVARSINAGLSWSTPIVLNPLDLGGSHNYPTIAADGNGNWVATWTGALTNESGIIVSRSNDDGLTWTRPAILNSNAALDTVADLSPDIATDGLGHWLVAWNSADTLCHPLDPNCPGSIGADPDILFARSINNGETWSSVAPLNTNAVTDPANAPDESPILHADGQGNWAAVWVYLDRSPYGPVDADLRSARSVDDGLTWSDPRTVNGDASYDLNEGDTQPDMADDGQGNWITVWLGHRMAYGGESDILYTMCPPSSDDEDSDTILDSCDNCPLETNTSQADTDSDYLGDACDDDSDNDGVSDGVDNCPRWANANQNPPPWPIKQDDLDCDGFSASVEEFVGTTTTQHCSGTTTPGDEETDHWPSDIDDNQVTNLADVIQMGGSYNKMQGQTGYSRRVDLNANGVVSLADVVLMGPFYNKSCA